MLGPGEIRSILDEKGKVDVDCEFCGNYYELDAVEVEELFASGHTTQTAPTRH